MTDSMAEVRLPEGTFKLSGGSELKLPDDIKGSWALLYFYPKDDTPGCTIQACGYRDNIAGFTELGTKVYGVSLDDVQSHDAFTEKFQLNFPLIVDDQKVLSEALGVYGDQEWKGKVYQGLSRDTFLVNPEGMIVEVWRKVNPATTIQETLSALKSHLSA